jgi:hypothetical protein
MFFQAGDDPGNGALGQVFSSQQRFQGLADATAVGAGQVTTQDGVVDLAHTAGVFRQELAAMLTATTIRLMDATAWNPDDSRPQRCGHAALYDAIAVAAAAFDADIGIASQNRSSSSWTSSTASRTLSCKRARIARRS